MPPIQTGGWTREGSGTQGAGEQEQGGRGRRRAASLAAWRVAARVPHACVPAAAFLGWELPASRFISEYDDENYYDEY